MQVVRLQEKLSRFNEHWSPKIVAELNGQHVKLAKLLGTFDWHTHDGEDELFYVLHGELDLELRDRTHHLSAGDLFVVPRGVEHRPVCTEEVHVMLFEPASTVNTGDRTTERTLSPDGLERL